MSQELWLFTMHYPYSTGAPFLSDELPVLARHFPRIRLFPFHAEGPIREVPDGVEVEALFTPNELNRPLAPWRLPAQRKAFAQLWATARSTAPDRATFLQHRRELASAVRQHLERRRRLLQRLAPRYHPERVRLYSYWGSDWATLLGSWRLHDPCVHFITRMHGFDLYRERAPQGWPRFQRFHLEQAAAVLAASEAGAQDLRARYPEQADRISTAPIATPDHGLAPWAPAAQLRIVSCARLVELKRVDLLAKALQQVERPIRWTHFGDGPERTAIEALVERLPPHVHVDLRGHVPHGALIRWYANNPVDAFIHTSRSEGGPVALKEAASFGIPLVAIDAGGVQEIVTPQSGKLLPPDVGPSALAEVLQHFPTSPWYTREAREQVRRFWKQHYDADPVYRALAQQLIKS